MILALLLASISWSQSTVTASVPLEDTLKIQNLSLDVKELKSGRPRLTGLPTFANGIRFSDGTTQTTAASLAPQYRVKVRQDAAQSIPDATATLLYYGAEIIDVSGMHSTSVSSQTLTVPSDGAGVWLIECTVFLNSATDGARETSIFVNGTEIQRCNSRAPNRASATQCLSIYVLAAADALTCKFLHNNGAPANTLSTVLNTFSAVRLWTP